MASSAPLLEARLESLSIRIAGLGKLRSLIDLRNGADLSPRQWQLVTLTLERAHARLEDARAKAEARLPSSRSSATLRALHAQLGRIELELTRAYGAFDTFMDVLTQRQGRPLGPWLKGCDVLAESALRRAHLSLRVAERPIVHCDRGFGASILRVGARLAAGLPTRLSLIQIPYARFEDKLHLTSILHEVGHEALHRLGLVRKLGRALYQALRAEGADAALASAFARWTRELGPDVWAFCASGLAATCTTREILSLPPTQVFQHLEHDPHPPPWLRVLFGYRLCQHVWGSGPWSDWAEDWREVYRLRDAGPHRPLLEAALRFLPAAARFFLEHRFPELSDRPLTALFDLSQVEPVEATRVARRALREGQLACGRRSISAHLAVFRALKLEGAPLAVVNRAMGQWLVSLAKTDTWFETRSDLDKEIRHAADA